MENVVPPSLLFDFRLSVAACSAPSKKATGDLLNLPDSAKLFAPSFVDGPGSFCSLSAGWNRDGLALMFSVAEKSNKPEGRSSSLDQSDFFKIWIDTRPSGIVHKATEYCHCFAVLPNDLDNSGAATASVQPIAQQRSTRIESNTSKFELRRHVSKTGYRFEIWIPGSQLYGYREISELGRIGFYYVANDTELGEQHFGVGADFPTSYDPSTWTQLELKP